MGASVSGEERVDGLGCIEGKPRRTRSTQPRAGFRRPTTAPRRTSSPALMSRFAYELSGSMPSPTFSPDVFGSSEWFHRLPSSWISFTLPCGAGGRWRLGVWEQNQSRAAAETARVRARARMRACARTSNRYTCSSQSICAEGADGHTVVMERGARAALWRGGR